nr:autotransporter outer membrane beta-barrel domain-containing protein [Sphingomicrobium aestuariivivum]
MADFAGLEIFENDGTIAFLDNGVEDVLDLTGSLFVAGEGSTLLFDASGDGDRLVLGDVEGTSALKVVGLTPELDDEILFVEVTGNADGAVFTVEETTRDAGFLNWRLTEEAGLIGLALAPDREVIEPARAGVLVTGLWHQSAEAARDSLSLLRTLPGDGRWGVFGQAYDVEQERDATDFAISHDGTGYSFALTGEEQGTGLEAGIGTRFGMVHVGLVAGTGSRELRIRESGNMMDADMTNIGLVAGYDDGRLSADAMIKFDQGELEMDLASADFRDTLDVDAFGASLGLRYRMDMGRLYVMPEASVAYASASLDGFDVDGGSFALEDSDSLRARLGARAGARLGTGKATLNPYAGLFLVNESGGANDVVFTSGADSIRVSDEEVGLFGQALGGVALTFDDSISLFAQGSFDFGEVEGVSLRGGLGVRF